MPRLKHHTVRAARLGLSPLDAAPHPDACVYLGDAGCGDLTPLIHGRLRELRSGQILEVISTEPAAREGVPAWSRLTGNELVAAGRWPTFSDTTRHGSRACLNQRSNRLRALATHSGLASPAAGSVCWMSPAAPD